LSGRPDEGDFLAPLYDLTSIPSTDYRMHNAAGDIHQHRVSLQDWDEDWVFYDSRINLIRVSDEEFLLPSGAHLIIIRSRSVVFRVELEPRGTT
jgi:hypothetical protein